MSGACLADVVLYMLLGRGVRWADGEKARASKGEVSKRETSCVRAELWLGVCVSILRASQFLAHWSAFSRPLFCDARAMYACVHRRSVIR